MDMKTLSIVCFVAAAISLCVATERYNNNVRAVKVAQQMIDAQAARVKQMGMRMPSMPGMPPELTGQRRLKASMPTSSMYAIAFAVIAGIGGVVCISTPNTPKPTYSKRRRASASINLPDQVPGMENADNDDA